MDYTVPPGREECWRWYMPGWHQGSDATDLEPGILCSRELCSSSYIEKGVKYKTCSSELTDPRGEAQRVWAAHFACVHIGGAGNSAYQRSPTLFHEKNVFQFAFNFARFQLFGLDFFHAWCLPQAKWFLGKLQQNGSVASQHKAREKKNTFWPC